MLLKKISGDSKSLKELLQEKEIWSGLNNILSTRVKELKRIKQQHEKNLSGSKHTIKELEQEKLMIKEIVENQVSKTHAINRKYYLTIAMIGVVLAAVVMSYSLYFVTLVGQEYIVQDVGDVRSGYVIQNLKGDTIDTWLSWRLIEDETLYVNIVNARQYPEQTKIIKNVILSKQAIEIDDSLLHKGPSGSTSLFYMGWAGALEKASQTSTKFFIPKNLELIDSSSGAGDITIRLTKERSGDGYSGYTRSIADENQNQILKSDITLFDVDNLSDNQLMTISRHELGHALGLAHASDPDDLMAPIVKTSYPYISECDVDAIVGLYDGGKSSHVVCEK